VADYFGHTNEPAGSVKFRKYLSNRIAVNRSKIMPRSAMEIFR
jgi:hypothetical protein